jgi:DNA-binding MarR family transcriptional regulator
VTSLGFRLYMSESNSAQSQDLSYDFCDSVVYLLSRAKLIVTTAITQRTLLELGITGQQAHMLCMVANGKCRLASELQREYGVDASAVTRLIDRLESRDLLKRIRNSYDRRTIQLSATAEGLALAKRVPVIFDAVVAQMMTGFDEIEIEFFANMLHQIIDRHSNLDNKTSHPSGSDVSRSKDQP